jgi:hypothetical protein
VNGQTAIFLVLVVNQLVGTATFIGIYRRSDWRANLTARHLMFWSLAAAALDLSWVLLAVLQIWWLMYLLFVAQAAVGVLTWQRVYLVVKAQRESAR